MFGLLLAVGFGPVRDLFWPTPDTNIAEAAALGDAARVRELAAQGMPLDKPLRVRAELLDGDQPLEVSALEAAVRRRSDSLVQILIELGARPSPDEGRRLLCLAQTGRDEQVAHLLEEAFAIPASACAENQETQGHPSSAKE
jgi:hypothetical protein